MELCAASRSRFATTLYVDAISLSGTDPESHREDEEPKERAELVGALAARMSRARAKATTLDFAPFGEPESLDATTDLGDAARKASSALTERLKALTAALRSAREMAGRGVNSKARAASSPATASHGRAHRSAVHDELAARRASPERSP